jgi:hypothetical protein
MELSGQTDYGPIRVHRQFPTTIPCMAVPVGSIVEHRRGVRAVLPYISSQLSGVINGSQSP